MKISPLFILILLLSLSFVSCGEETESPETPPETEIVEAEATPQVTISSVLLHWGLTEIEIDQSKHELLNNSLTFHNGVLTEERIFMDGEVEKIPIEGELATKAQFIIDDLPAKYLKESQVGDCVSENVDAPCWYLYLEKSDATGTTIVGETLPEDLKAYGEQVETFWEEVMSRE